MSSVQDPTLPGVFPESDPPLIAYCDGSGTISTLPAGCGVVLIDHGVIVMEASRHLGLGTNNHAELCGVGVILKITEAVEWRSRSLIVRSDSMYTITVLGAKKDPTEGRPNAALIVLIRKLLAARRERTGQDVWFEHVKGHSGIEGNVRADKLASLGRLRYPPGKYDLPSTVPGPVLPGA